MHEPTEQRIHKRREAPIGCLSPYMRTCVRTLLPLRTEHSQVALVAPLSVLLSGGEELVCLFRELFCYGSEANLALDLRGHYPRICTKTTF